MMAMSERPMSNTHRTKHLINNQMFESVIDQANDEERIEFDHHGEHMRTKKSM